MEKVKYFEKREKLYQLLNTDNSLEDKIDKLVLVLEKVIDMKGIIYVCGNGGSSTQAQHFAAELIGRFYGNEQPFSCISLSDNNAIMTSISNDISFDKIFSQQVETLCKKNDVLLCLSTSGKSLNIVNAINCAKKKNVYTILLTGNNEVNISDLTINILSDDTALVQEAHLSIIHIICEKIKKKAIK